MSAVSFVPAAPVHSQEASPAPPPFDWRAAWKELDEWRYRLRPPHKVYTPTLILCQGIEPGQYSAVHWPPESTKVLWKAEGSDPHELMERFRAYLRSLPVVA